MIEEDIGLSVTNITIQDAFPPTDEVMNAFKNVENAKQGKETAINNANKDRNEKIPQAEAECDQIIKTAEAEKDVYKRQTKGYELSPTEVIHPNILKTSAYIFWFILVEFKLSFFVLLKANAVSPE